WSSTYAAGKFGGGLDIDVHHSQTSEDLNRRPRRPAVPRSVPRRFVLALIPCTALVATSLVVLAQPAQAATYTPPATRRRVDLNAGWRFTKADVANAQDPAFDASAWSAVTVPHTWNAQDGQDGGNNYYRGVGWYRRHYTPPASFAGKKLWL